MGVTKQAAQKRFVPRPTDTDWQSLLADAFHTHPFSRFTPRAKHVVVAAQEEAREGRQTLILPGHLALGLLHEPEGLAARAIAALGVADEAAREALVAALPAAVAEEPVADTIPFAPRSKKVLELAMREALLLGHNYIGTEHILLGVLEEEESLGGGTLAGLGITRERAREWLVPVLEQMVAKRQDG
jgi:ATP-dependent Clp protease ATP-binding subunit ClpA